MRFEKEVIGLILQKVREKIYDEQFQRMLLRSKSNEKQANAKVYE